MDIFSLNTDSSGISFRTHGVSKIIDINEFPLSVFFSKYINDEIVWESTANDNWFVTYKDFTFKNITVTTKSGKIIFEEKFIPNKQDSLHQIFLTYCSSNPNNFGLAIGTHDGEYGEWVQSVKEGHTNAVLVEASDKQFNGLKNNYKSITNVNLIQSLVTPNGDEVSFFESESGYFNSTDIDHLKRYQISDIVETKKTSVSLKDLIKNNFDTKPSWMHLDVEGLDAKLILSLKDNVELLSDFIVFENTNLSYEDKNDVNNFLMSLGYELFNYDISTLAIKN
jgi:FkbM family methyltransferase